jgi:arylsulfatase A-like enzyme
LNVLLITADQWRGDCLSAVGHSLARTPNLDRLAAHGVLFARHHGQATPCGPARASLHTGLYALNHRSITNGTPLDARHRTMAQFVRQAGYDPVLFGYTDTSIDPRTVPAGDPRLNGYEGIAPGYRAEVPLPEALDAWRDHLAARGYGRRENVWDWYTTPLGQPAPWRAEDSETAFLADRFLGWLSGQGARPWFAHLSFIKPHPPLVAAAPFHALVDPAHVPPPVAGPEAVRHPWLDLHRAQKLGESWAALHGRRPGELEPVELRRLRAVYLGLIAEVDRHIGRIVVALAASGALDRTLLLVTSDHGEMLGEHGMLGKSGFFPHAFHVPLIVRAPKGARGAVVDRFTEHVDLMPTILDALGLEVPLQCDGRSLRPFLDGETPASWREATHWEHDFRDVESRLCETALALPPEDCGIAVRLERRWAYVHFAGLAPLLFDTLADPGWARDLAAEPAMAAAMGDCARGMLSWRMRAAERRLTETKLTPRGVIGRYDTVLSG